MENCFLEKLIRNQFSDFLGFLVQSKSDERQEHDRSTVYTLFKKRTRNIFSVKLVYCFYSMAFTRARDTRRCLKSTFTIHGSDGVRSQPSSNGLQIYHSTLCRTHFTPLNIATVFSLSSSSYFIPFVLFLINPTRIAFVRLPLALSFNHSNFVIYVQRKLMKNREKIKLKSFVIFISHFTCNSTLSL